MTNKGRWLFVMVGMLLGTYPCLVARADCFDLSAGNYVESPHIDQTAFDGKPFEGPYLIWGGSATPEDAPTQEIPVRIDPKDRYVYKRGRNPFTIIERENLRFLQHPIFDNAVNTCGSPELDSSGNLNICVVEPVIQTEECTAHHLRTLFQAHYRLELRPDEARKFFARMKDPSRKMQVRLKMSDLGMKAFRFYSSSVDQLNTHHHFGRCGYVRSGKYRCLGEGTETIPMKDIEVRDKNSNLFIPLWAYLDRMHEEENPSAAAKLCDQAFSALLSKLTPAQSAMVLGIAMNLGIPVPGITTAIKKSSKLGQTSPVNQRGGWTATGAY